MGDRESPNVAIRRVTTSEAPNMKRARIEIRQRWEKGLREVLVQQGAHGDLRGRNGENPALAFRSKREAREHIFVLELGKGGEDFALGHPTREVAKDVTDGQPGASNARLAEPDGRVNGNTLKMIHANKIRFGGGPGKQGTFGAPSFGWLTPAHHLRGAQTNKDLSAKVS